MTLFHEAGRKETKPRRRVLEALRAAPGPLTAQEVAQRAGTSLASTYRVLALLVELGLVAESGDGGAASDAVGLPTHGRRYTLCSSVSHHHHFLCRSCHRICDVESDALELALRQVAAELEVSRGLRIEEHELTLRGQCAECGKGGR